MKAMLFRGRSKHNWKDIFIQYGSRLASLSNHEEVYRTFLKTLVEVSGADGGSLLLFEPDLNEFTLKQHLGPTPLSFSVAAQHPFVLWLRRDGRPASRRQLAQDGRFVDFRTPALTFLSEFNAEIAFPLIAENKFLGILNLGPRGSKYEPEDLELFTTLISLGSVFIENSRLYDTLLRQNAKLAEVARLKTQFVSNITHELRTPLHGMLGLTDVLMDDPDQCLSANYRRYLEMMKNAGDALLELVDHILDLTKYQSGLVHLNVKKLDLRRIFEETGNELKDRFVKQNCSLVLDWPEITPSVYGDETEIRHVIRDLLGNAVKFTERGTVSVSPQKSGEMLKVCVHDTGIGIDERDQQEIFEDFRQADGSESRSFSGMGLGLALVRKIVELHGGRIWVESKKGTGSRFYFTLPLKPSHIQVIA